MASLSPQASADLVTVDPYSAESFDQGGPSSQPYTHLGGMWQPGPNMAGATVVPGPGGATWSIMGPGFSDASTFDTDHVGTTMAITALAVPGFAFADYAAMIDAALNVWASVSNFTNLGMVTDGGVAPGAPEAVGGALGDIRIGAWEIAAETVLAHGFEPGNEAVFGAGGSIGGDIHIDVNRVWSDDPTDTNSDADYDLFTVLLHELGHALGLGHSGVSGSVMESTYAGARRTLHADDIAGIQAIYGAPLVSSPEPSGFLLMSAAGLGFVTLRRLRPRKHEGVRSIASACTRSGSRLCR
ncbi:MAG: matrixin family metalloprotease [Planctomycetaceae bacterium]